MNGTAISVFACAIVVAGVLVLVAGLAGGDGSSLEQSAEAPAEGRAHATCIKAGGSWTGLPRRCVFDER